MRVLLDDAGIAHDVFADDYRLERLCERNDWRRSANPGAFVEATHINCVACASERTEVNRLLRRLRGN